jgi:hypothetical protein
MHPGQLSIKQENHRVEPALELIFPSKGGLAVGGSTAESERSTKLLLHFLRYVLSSFHVWGAELEISQVYLML